MSSVFVLILSFLVCVPAFAQPSDSITTAAAGTQRIILDTSFFAHEDSLSTLVSFYTQAANATRIDIQQPHSREKAFWIFIWILIFLFLLTILHNSFRRELTGVFTSFGNKATSMQTGTQTFAKTFSAIVLFIAFLINVSILTTISLQHFYPEKSFNTTHLLLLLLFLFTFFLATKTVVARTLGFIFDERTASELYISNMYAVVKTIAIVTFPIVMFIYVAEKKFLGSLIITFLAVIFIALLILIWRWLSTSIDLLYKSVYHFFVYICVVEILVVFLFIKLLTKNAF